MPRRKILDDFQEFFDSPLRNKYIETEAMSIYVRKSRRYVQGEFFDFIDFARVLIFREKDRGKGYFTTFFYRFIDRFPTVNVYVENVHNKRFCFKLLSMGLKHHSEDGITSCCVYLAKQSIPSKICIDCKQMRQLDEFYFSASSKSNSRMRFCIECHKKRSEVSKKKFLEKEESYYRDYRRKGRENLADWYIRKLLTETGRYTKEDLNRHPHLIEEKRKQILEKQNLEKLKKENYDLEREENCIGFKENVA